MGSSLGKFASPAAIWLGNLSRNLMIMAMMFGKQAPRSWKYLEECPKSLDICRYKLPQSVSFLMVVTRQGCWTKHIHNYFGLAMPKCRHASYKIGRWKEAHLQKEETDSSKWQDRPRKRSWRNISSVSFAIMWAKVWEWIFVWRISHRNLCFSAAVFCWIGCFPPKRMAIMIPFYIINQVRRTIKRLERSSLNHNLYFFWDLIFFTRMCNNGRSQCWYPPHNQLTTHGITVTWTF